MTTKAVFFDVDFTLIQPGPTFRSAGYRAFCERHGMTVDEAAFDRAVAGAAALLDSPDESPERAVYDAELYIAYTRRIIEGMGGHGPSLDACAREIYVEWAVCRHFELYDDVPAVLRELAARGLRLGLISNSHRCLVSFQSHFELDGLISAVVSSSEHGFLKPHPSIFAAALARAGVAASEAMMVGDNVRQDVHGALRTGMRAVLLQRGGGIHPDEDELSARGVPVIRSLAELPALIGGC